MPSSRGTVVEPPGTRYRLAWNLRRLARSSRAGTMTDQMEAARPAQPMAGRKPSGQMMPPIMGGTKVMSMVLVRPRRLLSKPHRSAM